MRGRGPWACLAGSRVVFHLWSCAAWTSLEPRQMARGRGASGWVSVGGPVAGLLSCGLVVGPVETAMVAMRSSRSVAGRSARDSCDLRQGTSVAGRSAGRALWSTSRCCPTGVLRPPDGLAAGRCRAVISMLFGLLGRRQGGLRRRRVVLRTVASRRGIGRVPVGRQLPGDNEHLQPAAGRCGGGYTRRRPGAGGRLPPRQPMALPAGRVQVGARGVSRGG